MQSHSFLADGLVFLYFPFWKETKIWDPCSFASAAFTPLSQHPRLPVSPVSLCSTHLQAWLSILPCSHDSCSCYPHTSHLFLASQAAWDSASHLASLQILQDANPGGKGPVFRYDLPAAPPIVSDLLLLSLEAMSGFLQKALVSGQPPATNEPFSVSNLQDKQQASSARNNFFFFGTVSQMVSHLFQCHEMDVIQKPHTEQARF